MISIDSLFKLAIDKHASDLHLAVNCPPMIRVDGQLKKLKYPPITLAAMTALLPTLMDSAQQAHFEQTFENDFSYQLNATTICRINSYRDANGPAIAARILSQHLPTLQQIGLSETVLHLCHPPKGIIFITGASGSGKSTTLAALINTINFTQHAHILTLEDPIEFYYQNQNCLINQRQIGKHTQSFNAALRSALREDPDIILVGELRDAETIHLTLTAAETGHLVLTTLHTSSATDALHRLIDSFPACDQGKIRMMLAQSLRAIIAQKLCQKIGGGRLAIREILINTPAIANMIRQNKLPQIVSAIQTGQPLGMITMTQSLQEKIAQGLIDPQSNTG